MRHYERFAPQTPNRVADPQYGIREIIVGTGGLGIDSFWVAQPNSEVRNSGTYGVLKLTLAAGGYSWVFVPAGSGTFTDAGSGTCHGQPPVTAVMVTPAAPGAFVGATVQLTAIPNDNGTPLPNRAVTWATNAPVEATVDPTGRVSALTPGTVTITATSEGQTGAAVVTVVPVPIASVAVSPGTGSLPEGSALQLTATPQDASGNPLANRIVTWTSSAPAVATVDATGSVSALSPGTATITATSEGQSGSAAVTVGAVLVGAGDIASCPGAGPAATAALLDGIPGTVFTLGDNAYPDRPRFTAGEHPSNTWMQPLWQALYDAGAELYIAGHDHDYERFAPQDANGAADPVRGIREFVVGTGGATPEPWSSITPPPIANEEVWANPIWGVLKLTLYPASRSEEHTSELQSLAYLVCRLLLEKKKKTNQYKIVVN